MKRIISPFGFILLAVSSMHCSKMGEPLTVQLENQPRDSKEPEPSSGEQPSSDHQTASGDQTGAGGQATPEVQPTPDPKLVQEETKKFRVTVEGGFGSGFYAPGESVTIWSGVSTKNQVALPWSGDANLLKTPQEWVSSFVMPNRDVMLSAQVKSQSLVLQLETFTGSTNVEKEVRYHFPQNMRGLVFFSHGTGGTSRYIENTETFAVALAFVERGFGVISTEAEEAAAGDLNGDGKVRWQTTYTQNNVDLKNLSILLAGLEQRGILNAATPKFALGMSNGGAFSHFLGAISASPIAGSFPRIKFNAVLGYCSDATQVYKSNGTKTPSAWYMCGRENHPEVSLDEARANEARIRAMGVPTEYKESAPTPLYSERFTRVTEISTEQSKAMAEELRAGGYVDSKGYLNKGAEEMALEIIDPLNASRFPTFHSLPESAASRVKHQLQVMRGEHAQYADLVSSNIQFFERYLP